MFSGVLFKSEKCRRESIQIFPLFITGLFVVISMKSPRFGLEYRDLLGFFYNFFPDFPKGNTSSPTDTTARAGAINVQIKPEVMDNQHLQINDEVMGRLDLI